MTVLPGPATLLEWILLASGVATFLVFGVGLQRFFIQSAVHNPRVGFFHDANIAAAVIHCVGVLSRRSPGEPWTIAGILLYTLAMLIFLSAVEATRGTLLPRTFVADRTPDRLITEGAYAILGHPIYVSYSLAWAAGPVATHSPTLAISAAILIGCYVVAARSESAQLAARFGDRYRAYRRWWR